MDVEFVIAFMFLLIIKHFVVDFLLQPKWMYANKGDLLHPGALAHSGLHVAFTAAILAVCPNAVPFAIIWNICLVEFLSHWITDALKVRITQHYNLHPHTDASYWYLMGADQFIHYATYIAMVVMFAKVGM